MRFSETIRAMRTPNNLNLRALGGRLGVSYADISEVENGKLGFGDGPGADLIRRLAGGAAATRR